MRSRSSASARSHSARGGRRRVGDRFERLRIGPGVRDGAVARHAAGQPVAGRGGHRFESLLDALVDESEPLFQAQHLFADDLEAEVTRLDDAGVHWTDRESRARRRLRRGRTRTPPGPVATSASASKSRRSGSGRSASSPATPTVADRRLPMRCRADRTSRAASGSRRGTPLDEIGVGGVASRAACART